MSGSTTTDKLPQAPKGHSRAGIIGALARVDAWSPQGCAEIVQPLTPPSAMEKRMNTHPTQTIRRSTPCFRILGTPVLVAACAGLLVLSTTAAYAGSMNGLSHNGLSTNGLSQNGLSTNGLSTNALAQNGIFLNGLPQDRCVLRASKLDTELPPLDQAQHLPWHRLSQQGLGKREP